MKRMLILCLLLLMLTVIVPVTLAEDEGNDVILEWTLVIENYQAGYPVAGSNCTEGYTVEGTITMHYWVRGGEHRTHMHQDTLFVSNDGTHTATSGFNLMVNGVNAFETDLGTLLAANVLNMTGSSEFYDANGLAMSYELPTYHVTQDENLNVRVARINPDAPPICYR